MGTGGFEPPRGITQQIYSLPPSTARPRVLYEDDRNRTHVRGFEDHRSTTELHPLNNCAIQFYVLN